MHILLRIPHMSEESQNIIFTWKRIFKPDKWLNIADKRFFHKFLSVLICVEAHFHYKDCTIWEENSRYERHPCLESEIKVSLIKRKDDDLNPGRIFHPFLIDQQVFERHTALPIALVDLFLILRLLLQAFHEFPLVLLQ